MTDVRLVFVGRDELVETMDGPDEQIFLHDPLETTRQKSVTAKDTKRAKKPQKSVDPQVIQSIEADFAL
jgi:hypothetical protein